MVRVLLTAMLAASAFAAGDPVKGKELFRTCAGCHNVDNDQRKMAPSLRTLFGKVTLRNGKHVDDANVREIVLEGFNGMPPFGSSFRPSEIEDLMAYLHTLTGKPAVAETKAGQSYFTAYCIRCHNPDSRTSPGPALQGRFKAESVELIEEGHGGAPPLKEWLDEPSRKALFEFLKTY